MTRATARVFVGAGLLNLPSPARAQQPPQQQPPPQQPETLDDTMEAGNEEVATPVRELVPWNHYDGDVFHIRVGAGFLYEGVGYSQNAAGAQQFDLAPDTKIRDARFIIKGGFKFKRPITFSAGIMYDVPTKTFLIRETGVMVAVPELSGSIFVGRTKEGFSLNKVMVGYAGWTMERTEANDATIPILADGIKW